MKKTVIKDHFSPISAKREIAHFLTYGWAPLMKFIQYSICDMSFSSKYSMPFVTIKTSMFYNTC